MSDDCAGKSPQNSFKNLLKRSGRQISEKLKISNATKDDDDYIKELQIYSDLVKFLKKFKAMCSLMPASKEDSEKVPQQFFEKFQKKLSQNQISGALQFVKDEIEYVDEIRRYFNNDINSCVIIPITVIENDKQAIVAKNIKNTNTYRLDYDNLKNSKKSKEVIESAKRQLDNSRQESYKSMLKFNNNTIDYVNLIWEFFKVSQKYHEQISNIHKNIIAGLEHEMETLGPRIKSDLPTQTDYAHFQYQGNATTPTSYGYSISTTSPESRDSLQLPFHEYLNKYSSKTISGAKKMVVGVKYESNKPNHLNARYGEHVFFLEKLSEDLYLVKNKHGEIGIIPKNCVAFFD